MMILRRIEWWILVKIKRDKPYVEYVKVYP
jgi:hypothetical protein